MPSDTNRPTTPAGRPVGGRGLRRRPAQRAGRPVLDPDVIAAQALSLLTRSGIESVTMARMARELGVSVRAIYHWIPSRAALLEAATLRAQESLPVPARTGDWRADLRRYRDAMFDWLQTHPGILDVQLVEGIAAVGPRVLTAHEEGLALFSAIGFAPRRARLLYAEYANWVAATYHFHIRPHHRATSGTDVFEQVVTDTHAAASPETHPLTAAAGVLSLDDRVESGFEWLLDSIEATLSRRDPDDRRPG